MRISDWSSYMCSSDLKLREPEAHVAQAECAIVLGRIEFGQQPGRVGVRGEQLHHRRRVDILAGGGAPAVGEQALALFVGDQLHGRLPWHAPERSATGSGGRGERRRHTPTRWRCGPGLTRSEEHTSELQSLMRISYAVFLLKK